MRKAEIDLDWVNESIVEYERVINNNLVSEELATIYNHLLNAFIEVRSKCTPIKEVEQVIVDSQGCMDFVFTELPPTCIQEWESARYCQNENKCKLCETKIKQ